MQEYIIVKLHPVDAYYRGPGDPPHPFVRSGDVVHPDPSLHPGNFGFDCQCVGYFTGGAISQNCFDPHTSRACRLYFFAVHLMPIYRYDSPEAL